jgi:tripeptidyl-peptidase-2
MKKREKSILIKIQGLLTLLFFCIGCFALPAYAYNDVPQYDASFQAIEVLTARNIVSGYGKNMFKPDNTITRAEFVTLLIKGLNMDGSANSLKKSPQLFRDVQANHWAKANIQLIWELGVAGGYTDNSFQPDALISRAEMVSMVVRALKLDELGGVRYNKFLDDALLPNWAKENIYLAESWGISSRINQPKFSWQEKVTRKEAAEIIAKMMAAQGNLYHLSGMIKDITFDRQKLTLTVNQQAELLTVAKGYSLDDTVKKGDNVKLVLNNKGEITYAIKDNTGGKVNITFSPGQELKSMAVSNSPSGQGTAFPFQSSQAILNNQDNKIISNDQLIKSHMNINKALNLTKLQEDDGYTGKGIKVAIIDSGVDMTHPDFGENSDGTRKFSEFFDVTNEGLVTTEGFVRADGAYIRKNQRDYFINVGHSKSNRCYYGFLSEKDKGIDFNQDGKFDGQYLVALVDASQPNVYDTVYIDTNNDGRLDDEKPFRIFNQTGEMAAFSSTKGDSFSFVVSSINKDGSGVKLGFDANGHGTQVAGLIGANGTLQGVAPDSQLIMIKALDKKGETSWENLESAIKLAVKAGAHVVNLSVGYDEDITSGNNSLTYLIDNYSKNNGIIFIVAAGNNGPGVSTVATPSNAKRAISVGAYMSPIIWKTNYGLEVPQEGLMSTSAIGPRPDGMLVPTVVAPGSAISTYPRGLGGSYKLGEGTSIAAPQVAGAVALLLQGAKQNHLPIISDNIKRALMYGARKINDYNYAEAGFGLVDVNNTWRIYRKLNEETSFKGYTWNRMFGIGEGLFAKDYLPGNIPYRVGNISNTFDNIYWNSTEAWLSPLFKVTSLPSGQQRDIPVHYLLPKEPGLYTGLLEGKVLLSNIPEMTMLTTVVKPYEFQKAQSYELSFNGEPLKANQYKRYFLKVPENVGHLDISFGVAGAGFNVGRGKLYIFDPGGMKYSQSPFIGKDSQLELTQYKETIQKPKPGIWEVIVEAPPDLSNYQLNSTAYQLKAQLFEIQEVKNSDNHEFPFSIGCVPSKMVLGKRNYISMSLRYKSNGKPVEDLMVEVNGQMYHVENGWLTMEVVPEQDVMPLKIKY